jgi:excisionase family DNA binding protein
MSVPSDRVLLTIAEAARLAGLAKSVAYRLAAQDELPGLVKLPGCQMLVRRRVLEAWLNGAPCDRSEAPDGDAPWETHGPGERPD